MDHKVCSRCKCIRVGSDFVGESGKACKRCKTCRSYDKKYDSSTNGKIRRDKLVLHYYKIGADKRNLGWYLSDEYAEELLNNICHYCGQRSNGIDRVDNSQCYVPSNCVSCCTVCNFAKGTLGYQEFIDMCRLVASNFPIQ